MPKIKYNSIHRNFFFARDRSEDLPWVRISSLAKATLARPVVLVNGAFDLLHVGHMKLLFAARKKGATVVCAMDSDRKVREAKGAGHPVMTFPERYATLNYMPVDYVVEIDGEKDMARLVKILNPDLRVQGQDYHNKPSRFPGIRKMFVHDVGMRTSKIIERIKNASQVFGNL